jgi:hypothetical protein
VRPTLRHSTAVQYVKRELEWGGKLWKEIITIKMTTFFCAHTHTRLLFLAAKLLNPDFSLTLNSVRILLAIYIYIYCNRYR